MGMMINPLTALPATAMAVPGALAGGAGPLSDTFQKLTQPQAYGEKRKEAQEAAAGLVSTALILPILQQIRRSPFNQEGPFSPGTAEKTFGPEFDMQIADRIAHSPRLGITKALTDRVMSRGKPAAGKGLDVHG